MERIAIVSTNDNPDYYFYSPYIKRAWNNFGWKVACLITRFTDPKNVDADYIIRLPEIPGIRTQTQAQGGRLYAANYLPEQALLMTSDMDMLPLSDYWNPSPDDITVYGHDLTDYSYFPMGYIAMRGTKWKEVMNLHHNTKEEFLRDANETKIAFAEDWESWWNFDWDLITKRLMPYKPQIKFINRGRRPNSPFAFGRIDRGDSMTLIPQPWIDGHCENNNVKDPGKLERFLHIYRTVHGGL